ncbi:MAG: hypothetical protein QM770_17670 [Tepidisphaeraceae bacterium]
MTEAVDDLADAGPAPAEQVADPPGRKTAAGKPDYLPAADGAGVGADAEQSVELSVLVRGEVADPQARPDPG